MLRWDSGSEGSVKARRQGEAGASPVETTGAVENRLEKMSDISLINYS